MQRLIHRLSNLLKRRAVILLYHRVAELHPDPQLLCVTPAHFAEHLEHLRQHYQPISLQALGQALVSGEVSHKAVVVTFDDGYVDNLLNAKSLLEHYHVPTTVFVSTGFVERGDEFTSDVLERCLLQSQSLPSWLTLVINGETYHWQIDDYQENTASWNVTMGYHSTRRHQCYHELHALLRPLNHASRQGVLEPLANWASCSTNARPSHRMLNSTELKILSKNGLVEIGAHGVNHLVLAKQPLELQWKEISESKRYLEDILGWPVTSFSYPYGGSNDASHETVRLVKQAGFQSACANVAAPVTTHSDLFWLTRYLVRDWSGQEFAKHLKEAFRG